MDAIILLGGPGAGKGTLAELLKDKKGYLHVSTGDILRAAVKSDSEIGREAKPCMDAGELVSDNLVLKIIKERIAQEPSDSKFLFDGFPRTLEQAQGLQILFAEINGTISHVLNLDADREALIPRLTSRRTCRVCGAIYHLIYMPPKVEGICDVEGGELYQRADDSEATILNRLDVYQKQTAPLIGYYREKGLVRDIDAGGSVKNTDQQAIAVLNG